MKKLKIALLLLLISVLAAGVWGYSTYKEIYNSNVDLGSNESEFILIPTNSNFEGLINILEKSNYLIDIESFEKVADLKSFSNVKSGRYKVLNNMSNNALIGMLRIGDQTPVNITFNNVRTIPQLAGKISKNLELDSLQLVKHFTSSEVQKKFGFNSATFISMFIADTYQVFWDISIEELTKRMAIEYKQFWKKDRRAKAKKLGLSQSEVTTLASIVQLESLKRDEQPKIAGVYLNRLRIGMPLQADPTVIFAVGDFTIKRVLKKHLEMNSPYNTYKNKGLPPGPIYLASPNTIDAVLNYETHKYIYFCAKEDFSGYHSFATNYNQHINNARRYQRALNKRRIYK